VHRPTTLGVQGTEKRETAEREASDIDCLVMISH
jgi:hypothetical protein